MSSMQYATPRPLSALLSNFPIRTLASDTEALKDGEVLVKCSFMSGETHLVAIADWQLSSTIALFAGHIAGVYHERIYLAAHCDELGNNCPMTKVKELIEKTDGFVNVLVKDPPKMNYTPSFMRPDILVGRRAYGSGLNTDDGW